jgi:hypothetical protein
MDRGDGGEKGHTRGVCAQVTNEENGAHLPALLLLWIRQEPW